MNYGFCGQKKNRKRFVCSFKRNQEFLPFSSLIRLTVFLCQVRLRTRECRSTKTSAIDWKTASGWGPQTPPRLKCTSSLSFSPSPPSVTSKFTWRASLCVFSLFWKIINITSPPQKSLFVQRLALEQLFFFTDLLKKAWHHFFFFFPLLCCRVAAPRWQIRHHAGVLARRAQAEAAFPGAGSDPGGPAAGQQPTRKSSTSRRRWLSSVRVAFSFFNPIARLFARMWRTTPPSTSPRARRTTVSRRLHRGLHPRRSWGWRPALCPTGTAMASTEFNIKMVPKLFNNNEKDTIPDLISLVYPITWSPNCFVLTYTRSTCVCTLIV